MGTNYYSKEYKGNRCKSCGRSDEVEEKHIGKSSGGWQFCFDHWYNEHNSFNDWKKYLEQENVKIFDEYNREVSLNEFIEIVESKQSNKNGNDGYDMLVDGYRFSKSSDFS